MGLLDKLKQTVSKKKKEAEDDDDFDDDFDFDDIESIEDMDGDNDDDLLSSGQSHGLSDLPSAQDDHEEPGSPDGGDETPDGEPVVFGADGFDGEDDGEGEPEPDTSDPYAGKDDDFDPDLLLDDEELAPDAGAGDYDDGEDYDDEYEDDDWDDYEDDEDDRKKLIAVIAAAFLLIGGVIGGAGWWFLGGSDLELEEEVAAVEEQAGPAPGSGFALPPRGGGGVSSLNELKGADDRPGPQSGASDGEASGDGDLVAPAEPTFGPDTSKQQGFGLNSKLSRVPKNTGERPLPKPTGEASSSAGEPAAGADEGEVQSLNQFATRPKSQLELEFGLSEGEPEPGVGVIVRAASFTLKDQLPDLSGGSPLAPAPDPNLLEPFQSPEAGDENQDVADEGEEGGAVTAIPKIGDDGQTSWQAYARPFDGAGKRLAIVIREMGMSVLATEAVINRFPPEIALAFSPYAMDAGALAAQAREKGHEVWLSLPMEPVNFPFVDPGPLGLFTAINRSENEVRLNLALSKIQGYVGVTTDYGTQFTVVEDYYRPVLETLQARGLAVLDVAGSSRSLTPKIGKDIGLAWNKSDMMIGVTADLGAVDQQLKDLEKLVLSKPATVVTVTPYPNVLRHLGKWLETVKDKGITLAPPSALLRKPAQG